RNYCTAQRGLGRAPGSKPLLFPRAAARSPFWPSAMSSQAVAKRVLSFVIFASMILPCYGPSHAVLRGWFAIWFAKPFVGFGTATSVLNVWLTARGFLWRV